jgi:Flp pilus assembly protein TadD
MAMGRWVCFCLAVVGMVGCETTQPTRFRDYNEDGVYLFQRGRYADAQESFQAALAIQANDPGVLYNLGECRDRLGDPKRAEAYYRDCLSRAPNHLACRHSLVVLLVRQGRRPEASRLVQDWILREPKSVSPYVEDGWLAHQDGDLPRAQARLQQALEIDPHNEQALMELGLVYEELKRPDRALVIYDRILQQNPNQSSVTTRVNFLLAKGARPPHPDS